MEPIDVSSIQLGGTYQDTVTGFEGVATSRIEYLNGCVQAMIEGHAYDPGAKPAEMWVDYDRLVLVQPADAVDQRATGGPQATPPGLPHPRAKK